MRRVNLDKVNEYVGANLIRARQRGPETVCSYNELTMRINKTPWDNTLRLCRGIRFHTKTGMITGFNFSKFFNLNEVEETKLENLPQEPFTVTEKLDGSLILSSVAHDGTFCHTTKASWDNDYTRAAAQYFPHVDFEDRLLSFVSEIFIENDPMRRVTERAKGLHLITVFDELGNEYPREEVERLANKYNLYIVPEYRCESLHELAKLMDTIKGTEGYVVKFQSGLRVKFKSVWYRAINYMLDEINSPEKARETIKEYLIGNGGRLDWIDSWPEELQGEVREIAENITDEYLNTVKEVTILYNIDNRLSHKDFALKYKDHKLFHHLMAKKRGHDNWKDRLWKIV